MTLTTHDVAVTGGVDTHRDTHVAAAVDHLGRLLGVSSFPADTAGYGQLLEWLTDFGAVEAVGVEGTGSYGSGLARFLAQRDVTVVEVSRPNRQVRRRRGKSDSTDAEAAARAALSGESNAVPKRGDGKVEALRLLRVVRRSAVQNRTQAVNQLRGLIVTAPAELREALTGLSIDQCVTVCTKYRPENASTPLGATKTALRFLARRHQSLSDDIAQLDNQIRDLCAVINPALLGALGVGPDVASALLVVAGDNPDRLRSEASFASLCGSSPVEASSGRVIRHRLNRGGNGQANNALWRIVMIRLRCDPATRAYAERRRAEGRSTREIIRCLKRFVAREIHQLITDPPPTPDARNLRVLRQASGVSLATLAAELATQQTRISQLERGVVHDHDLAVRYQQWLESRTCTQ